MNNKVFFSIFLLYGVSSFSMQRNDLTMSLYGANQFNSAYNTKFTEKEDIASQSENNEKYYLDLSSALQGLRSRNANKKATRKTLKNRLLESPEKNSKQKSQVYIELQNLHKRSATKNIDVAQEAIAIIAKGIQPVNQNVPSKSADNSNPVSQALTESNGTNNRQRNLTVTFEEEAALKKSKDAEPVLSNSQSDNKENTTISTVTTEIIPLTKLKKKEKFTFFSKRTATVIGAASLVAAVLLYKKGSQFRRRA